MNITTTEALEGWNTRLSGWLTPDSVILVLYIVVGVLGNSSVIIIHKFRMNGGTDDRYFIPYLALADLTSCVINSSSSLLGNFLPVKYTDDIACKVLYFLSMQTITTSALLLVLISVHRYTKICRPFSSAFTLRRKRFSLLFIVIVSLALSWPCLFLYGVKIVEKRDNRNTTGYKCTYVNGPWGYSGSLVFKSVILVIVFLLLIVLCITYTLIGKVVFRHIHFHKYAFSQTITQRNTIERFSKDICNAVQDNGSSETKTADDKAVQGDEGCTKHGGMSHTNNKKKRGERSSKPRSRRSRTGVRLSIMFMMITVVFIISFVPKALMMVYESRSEDFWLRFSRGQFLGYRILFTLFIIETVVNPFIYGYFDVQFRNAFVATFCSCFKRLRK